MPTILGANTADDSYEISNSLRLNDGDSPRLNRTTTTATNDDKATLSVWAKRGTNFGSSQNLIGWDSGGSAQGYFRIFNGSDNVQLYNRHASETATSVIASAKLRDPSAWYHIVLKYDAAQSTSSDRVKIYINGTEQTLGTTDYPPQDTPLGFNYGGRDIFLACWNNGSEFVDGHIAEFAFLDGQALDPTYFGETNNNGVWVPKEFKDDVTFGNNGFYLEFKQTGTSANSSGIGADTSGNDNHFSVTNLTAADITTDTPTNNFCTLNPVSTRSTLSEGNTKYVSPQGASTSTIAVGGGKWYMEFLIITQGGILSGFVESTYSPIVGTNQPWDHGDGAFYYTSTGQKALDQSSFSDYAATSTNGDIIGVAVDLDNDTIQFYKNGSALGSISKTFTAGNFYTFVESDATSATNSTGMVNFGHDSSFAGEKTAQNNSDENGYGDFYYSPPTGYYAICTKNLAEFG
jgi:hypothetical protein